MSADYPAFPVIPGVRFVDCKYRAGYAVSDDGNVWSCVRGHEWRRLKPTVVGAKQYRRINISRGKSLLCKMLHVIVAEHFIGDIPNGYEVAHFPSSDTSNNAASNLRITTPLENAHHRHLHGTDDCAPLLTPEMAEQIRQLHSAGISKHQLAKDLKLGHRSIVSVLEGTYRFRKFSEKSSVSVEPN